MKDLLGKAFLLFGLFFGVLAASVAVYYYRLWLIEVENSLRHEYLMGVGIGMLWSTPSFIFASMGTLLIDTRLSKWITIPMYSVSIIIGFFF